MSSVFDWVQPGTVITRVVNPRTGTMVKLVPSYTLNPELTREGALAELSDLVRRVERYCEAAWMLGRIDPPEITASGGWVRYDPRDTRFMGVEGRTGGHDD